MPVAPAPALTALWVLERVYLEAWTGAVPGAPAFREFVEHWTEPAFAGYVESLAAAADAALHSAGGTEQAGLAQPFPGFAVDVMLCPPTGIVG